MGRHPLSGAAAIAGLGFSDIGKVYGRTAAAFATDAARAAVGVVHRRQLSAAEDVEALRGQLADEYFSEHLRAETAAASGFVDELVEPVDTRDRLASALWTLAGGL